MNIEQRNQAIVTRRTALEPLEAIGNSFKPKLSRERVRQIFNAHATTQQKRVVARHVAELRTAKPRPEPKVATVRACFFLFRDENEESDRIRELIDLWRADKIKPREIADTSPDKFRKSVYLTQEQEDAVAGYEGGRSELIRGLIRADKHRRKR
jgi:hypothetical protein